MGQCLASYIIEPQSFCQNGQALPPSNILLNASPKVAAENVPGDVEDDLDSFGMSEEEEATPDPAASEPPFIWKKPSGVQALVIPSLKKECALPGRGKKGGCDDWVLGPLPASSGEPKKYQIMSDKDADGVKSRLVDQLLSSSRLCQPIHEDSIAECRRPNMVPTYIKRLM